MTRYEQGFMNKCAEAGLSADEAVALIQKVAERDHLEGAKRGAGIGAVVGASALGAPLALAGGKLGYYAARHGGFPKDLVVRKGESFARANARAMKAWEKVKVRSRGKSALLGILSALAAGGAGALIGGTAGAVTGGAAGGIVGKKKKRRG